MGHHITTLSQILTGDFEGHSFEEVGEYMGQCSSRLCNCIDAFQAPSCASRSKVKSGAIVLEGGLKVQVPVESREVVWSISHMLGLDEVDTFIL